MLLKKRLPINQVFRYTWKVDLLILLCCTVVYFVDKYWLALHVSIPVAISAVLGTAIAFFIGFNNNQAYDRWWEARIIWGALVNDSRSWARNLLAFTSPGSLNENNKIVRHMINRHLSFIYALKANLRKQNDDYYTRFLEQWEIVAVQSESNIPNAILNLQAADLQLLSQNGAIDGFRLMQMNDMLVRHCDSMGKSERIKNTVFPTSYLFFTQMFIWFYVILNTLMMTETIGAWSILFGWAFGFVYHVTHLNGINLMNPFADNPLSIPLDSISRTIEINLLEMLGDELVPAPVKPKADGLYIM